MKVLEGIRVVELTQVIAGPLAGAILSDLGAEVIKVEKPNGGDDGRQPGQVRPGNVCMVVATPYRGQLP